MNQRTKRYTRFCGIDVHKRTHVACALDRDGQFLIRSQSFGNDAEGFGQLLQRLNAVGKPEQILLAMEATGHYWYSLHDFLVRQGYTAIVLNPIQTAQQAKKGIRKTKTDKTSARHIATLIKNGEHRPAQIPGPLAMTCRQVTRLRYALMKQQARIKQLLRSRLHPAWPEFEASFADPFCVTARTLLAQAPTPQDLLAIDADDLTALLRGASRGKLGAALAQRLRKSAETSIGMRRGLQGVRICIRTLLDQLQATIPLRKQLETQIEDLADRIPHYIFTLPAVAPLSGVSLFGEIDPVETFASSNQLVAFSGLDTTVAESGQSANRPGGQPRRRISKRGSPYLRRTLWMMAHRAAYLEGDLRTYFLRKRSHGLHHLAAVTATATKLCRIVWRIMTDQRDYLPDSPSTEPVSRHSS